ASTDVHGGTVTYSLSDDAGGRFAIDATTGVVTVANATQLDYETATINTINVNTADAAGAFTTQTFTIAVTDVAPSTPTDSDCATRGSPPESTAFPYPTLFRSASTDVHGGTVTYSLSDDAGGRFAIDATTGVVTVANATQ